MNVKGFNEEIKKINATSWGYGNEILYCMTKNPCDLMDKDRLSAAIWLIGRAYAASPQRRSYGIAENKEGYISVNGDTPKKRPVWPVRTQNDGREGFFDKIAGVMIEHMKQEKKFQKFIKDYSKNRSAYKYDCSDEDIKRLIDSIVVVLKYNLFLSQALETFDEVPTGHDFKGDPVYCSNHISFSSKLLHFYFPHRVFIIDNFARDGGKHLFNGNETTKPRTFYDAPLVNSDIFESEIYNLFSKDKLSGIYEAITSDSTIQTITEDYNGRTRKPTDSSGDNSTLKDYIEHCIRSYLLGEYVVKEKIIPLNQIKDSGSYSVESMPRLTDAVFLNIKAPFPTVMKKHYRSLKDVYGIKYIKI